MKHSVIRQSLCAKGLVSDSVSGGIVSHTENEASESI